jgi:hypothetical protein
MALLALGISTTFLMTMVFMDNTPYILNLYVQAIGYYVNYVFHVGFNTDALQQLNHEFEMDGSNYVIDHVRGYACERVGVCLVSWWGAARAAVRVRERGRAARSTPTIVVGE